MNTKRIAIYIMLVVLVIGVHGVLKIVWVTLVAAVVAAAVAAWVTRKMSSAARSHAQSSQSPTPRAKSAGVLAQTSIPSGSGTYRTCDW